jgi:hypothetical protein
MLCLQALQLAHEPVVLGIGNLDIIQRVITVIVVSNLVTQ